MSGFDQLSSVGGTEMETSRQCDCCWAELLRSYRPALRLFTCLRAWRYVTLQRKHRLQAPTAREWQLARFFEMELPLHAVVAALNHNEDLLDESFGLVGSVYALYPMSAKLLDHQRRPPLYYALEQCWRLEKLSWLVDKSLETVFEKDSEGLALTTHAILNNCPEELVIRLAVAAASRCILAVDELLDGQHVESARRVGAVKFCQRALLDFFAGVPKFPHSQCRDVLGVRRKYGEAQAHIASTAIKDIWIQFIDTWGHFGAPLLQRDLPEALNPVIDSFVEVSLVAKGEPLSYQWFIQQDGQDDATPMEGATQSFILLSPSVQPHNEGIYYCEITNHSGCVCSTRMNVRVVDDRVPPDPTLNFVVDRAQLAKGVHTLRCLKASAGGWVYQTQTDAAIAFPPDFFTCLDRDGNNVSDSHGVEIGISCLVAREQKLTLRRGGSLVSCLFEVLPESMGDLLRPSLLWMPHFLVPDTNNVAVVVEIDTKSGRVLRDVEYAVLSDLFARVTIHRLGAFAVVSRPKALRNDDSTLESPVERARLFLLRPTTLSANAGNVKISVALVRDLANYCGEAMAQLREKADGSASIESFPVSIRENFSLNLLILGGDRVVFRWPPPSSTLIVAAMEIALNSTISCDHHPTFLELFVNATVSKTPIQTQTRVNFFEPKSVDTVSRNDWILFEDEWVVMIPFLRDDKTVFGSSPPTPSILERTNTRLVLNLTGKEFRNHENDYDLSENSKLVGNQENDAETKNAEDQFSPYFYVVEMATFTPTFWRRYNQTWWFDKTKTSVIDGMYKVVHRGFDTKVPILTSAYAGCVRVAYCSIDCFGRYSDPLLLTPLTGTSPEIEPSIDNLRRFASYSSRLEETTWRLKHLVDDLQIDNDLLKAVYGLPSVENTVGLVETLLKAKTSLCSCNFKLALLLSGFKALERQISQIKIASEYYAKVMERFLRLQRVIPELDYSPTDSFPITRRLHELLREVFGIVLKLSTPGWMQYFLLDEWFERELHNIFLSAAGLLESDDCCLQCAPMLSTSLKASISGCFPWKMETARSHLLLVVGRLQEASDPSTKLLISRELCHTIELYPDLSTIPLDELDEANWSVTEELLAEFESPSSQQALASLRQQDTLAKHLLRVTPSDGEKCVQVPEAVHFDLDPFIRGVQRTGMHLVIRVANVSLDNCTVQGRTTFDERITRLSFFPAAEFERKSRYRVTVREQEIISSLGGTLPERSPFTVYFSTPA